LTLFFAERPTADHITNITLDSKTDIIEVTGFSQTSKNRVSGLTDNTVTIDFIQDFASSSVEATIYPLVGTVVAVTVAPTSGADVITSNPTYSFNALVSDWTPLKGAVGQLSTASVTWSISGAITKG
jgi:hypothetical protein